MFDLVHSSVKRRKTLFHPFCKQSFPQTNKLKKVPETAEIALASMNKQGGSTDYYYIIVEIIINKKDVSLG